MIYPDRKAATRRARRFFWILVVVSVLASGTLSDALSDEPAPTTGLRVAASGLVLVVSVALAARILLAIDRARTRARHPVLGGRAPARNEGRRP